MIEINNLTTVEVDEKPIKNIIEKVLEKERPASAKATAGEAGDISIAFVGQGRIRVLNKRYRKKNRVTDVLAFPELKLSFEKFRIGPTKKFPGLGELVICLREVKKNAKKYNSSFEKELARVLIHGTLHLLGYDHEKNAEAAEKMEEREKNTLSKLFDNKVKSLKLKVKSCSIKYKVLYF